MRAVYFTHTHVADIITRYVISLTSADVAEGLAASASPKAITVDDDITLTCGASKYYYYDNVTWFFNDSKLSQLTPAEQIAG